MKPIRLLVFSTLFPNAMQPNHGVFVENRLRHLVETGEVEATVVAPVPWFPSSAAVFGTAAKFSAVPRVEHRHGLEIHHPRYAVIPKIGMNVAASLLYASARRYISKLVAQGSAFDVVDAHYFYPDGVAAVRLGRALGKKVVVTARGSDITQLATFRGPRSQIVAAATQADWMITVSASLRDGLIALGAAPDRITTLRNGIDTRMFHPVDGARSGIGPRRKIISVGLLIERKRHHLTIEAMRSLPDCDLLIVGEGPERPRLEALIARLGLSDRVRLHGACPHAELPALYSAADIMILASSREGWANVLLEAMACGTPVVAMRIGGNTEVVQSREAGMIVDDATPDAIADGVRDLLADPPDRGATRDYAEAFGWGETTAGQLAIFRRLLA